MIGENGKNLKYLTITFPKVRWGMYSELSKLLGDAFSDMFKGLKNFKSLQIVALNISFVEIEYYFLKFPDTFSSYSGAMVTHLAVRDMTCRGTTLSEINRRFPNLKYFCAGNAKKVINTRREDLSELVNDIFPDKTKVEITFWILTNIYQLSKMPFHKSVVKRWSFS